MIDQLCCDGYCHKNNRYSRGWLVKDDTGTEVFLSIRYEYVPGKNSCTRPVYNTKRVDETFLDNFIKISSTEMMCIDFEEDRLKNKFLEISWVENGLRMTKLI